MTAETGAEARAKDRPEKYGGVAQGFHWLIAALLFAAIGIALYMTDLPKGPEKFEYYALHKSFGVTILGLAALRLLWRFMKPPPELPSGMPAWELRAAQLSHFALYALLLAQPIIGVLGSWAANFPISVFGLFTLPNLTGPSEAMKGFWNETHSWLGWAFIWLIVLHIAAAVKHHFIDKDNVLTRMLPGGPR